MSLTSTATALAAYNFTLGDEHKIANYICILVANHGDSTPFSPDSFQVEDLVELCIGLGQAHLEGVLWISETEAVLAFQSTSKLTAVMHLLGVSMVWYDEPIKCCVCPPTAAQAREYVASRGQHPFGTQAPGLGREVVSCSPLVSDPYLEWGPTTIPYGSQRPQ